jgi:hypothetical protein
MQQFTVPQFIDVENKIIGPITVRQFMIFLSAAIIIALGYRLFDFALFATVGTVVMMLAVVFAFVRINAQPFHLFALSVAQTLRRPKIRVWNNRLMAPDLEEFIVAPILSAPTPAKVFKKSRLAELALIVDTKGKYKGE